MKSLSFDVVGNPDYSMLNVLVPAGQTLKVEAAAMAAMDDSLQMKTKLRGGLGRFLTNESLFLNHFVAQRVPGQISISPGSPGDICHYYLEEGHRFFLSAGNFLASSNEIDFKAKLQSLGNAIFSGQGFFIGECSGHGDIWFSCFGAAIPVEVSGEYVVDTGHIVAFTEGLSFTISMVGGYKSLFFSGEGLVCRFRGQGKVWIQSKRPRGLAAWADAYRRVQKSS